ncbi:MAG: hypothetical protein AAFQ87_05825, partial [Bacteroidota bacterium]
MLRYLPFFVFIWAISCQPASQNASTQAPEPGNPPYAGFDEAGSDAKAIAIADEVMEAMGGRAAWDATRYLEWNFFGARKLTWDKLEQRVRIEIPRDSTTLLANYETKEGRAMVAGQEITNPDTLAMMMEQARRAWINDSYWLVMPFKLKDSGVTLNYVGQDSAFGEAADVLSLTFKEVGVTPQNKYHVWVSQKDQLVKQWSYYPNATDDSARFVTPWVD